MKTLTNKFIWLTLAVLLPVVVFTPGCSTTTPPAAIAYHTLRDTQIAVDNAMVVYGEQCALGKLSVATQAKVDSAHANYRIAFRSAVTLARFDYTAATPDTVSKLATDLLQLISQL